MPFELMQSEHRSATPPEKAGYRIDDDKITGDLLASQRALAEHLEQKAGGREPVELKILKQVSYPYSVIRIVDVTGSELIRGRYYIKRLLPSAARFDRAENQCKDEARLLSMLKERMPTEVVDIVLVLPERLTITTAECSGAQFSQLLRGYVIRRHLGSYQRKVVQASVCCGVWLRRFHSITTEHDKGISEWIDFQCGEAEWRAKELCGHDPEGRKIYERAAGQLGVDFQRISTSTVCSMIHRDFAPHNIFVHPSRVIVLDFTDARYGHGASDVVNFIASLASRCEPRFVSTKLVQRMCAAFFDSYGGFGNEDRSLYKLILVLQSLKRLLVLYQSKHAGTGLGQRGAAWHKAYLNEYVESARDDESLLKGPWPFLKLTVV